MFIQMKSRSFLLTLLGAACVCFFILGQVLYSNLSISKTMYEYYTGVFGKHTTETEEGYPNEMNAESGEIPDMMGFSDSYIYDMISNFTNVASTKLLDKHFNKSWLKNPKDVNTETARGQQQIGFSDSYINSMTGICTTKEDVGTQFKVPNIVHYNWYTPVRKKFVFKHWISVLSVYKILRPRAIVIRYNLEPIGMYWDIIKKIPSVYPLKEKPPESLLGEKVTHTNFFTHASDVGRIAALLETGGIYLDFDVLIIRSFDKLRKYPCTIGYESSSTVCGGIIICSKDSPFLYLWANAFLDDFKVKWAYNSGMKPSQLAKRFPHLIHKEMFKLNRPSWYHTEIGQIWGNDTWKWKDNFAVHTWYRLGQKYRLKHYPNAAEPSLGNIWTMNNTFAEICRYILRLSCH